MTSREKFEAWYLENWGHTEDDHETLFERDPESDEEYYRLGVRLAWGSWQASSEASEQKLEESQREFRAADATIHNLELKLTDMAVQLANAESKCRELAGVVAENAALKTAAEFATAPDMWIEQADGMLDYRYVDWYVDVLKAAMETPATDAFLAEVRAQGVEMFAFQQSQIAAEQEQAGDYEFSRHCSISAAEACEFAEELREGKCCEVES